MLGWILNGGSLRGKGFILFFKWLNFSGGNAVSRAGNVSFSKRVNLSKVQVFNHGISGQVLVFFVKIKKEGMTSSTRVND